MGADLEILCDLEDPKQIKNLVTKSLKEFARLDVLVNNAGFVSEDPFHPNSSDELWHKIHNINLHGPYYLSKECLPALQKSKGRIINISSVLGLKGVGNALAYCSAKHALVGFTKALSHYVAKSGVTVNAICPGWTDTGMAQSRMKEIGISAQDAACSTPIGRIVKPEEVAAMIYYLASSEAAAVTGQSFVIDGGGLA